MSYILPRRFCCCLPVRFGVIVIAFLGLAGGTLFAVAGILHTQRISGSKAPVIILIVIYTLLSVLSIFGLIGALAGKRRLVSLYCLILICHIVFSIISGAFSLYRLFLNLPVSVEMCINDSDNPSATEGCNRGMEILKGSIVTLFIAVWLIEIWGIFIVYNYSKQLEEEEGKSNSEMNRLQW